MTIFYSTIIAINLEIENLGGNIYIIFCLIAIFELLGGVVTFLLLSKLTIVQINEYSVLTIGILMALFTLFPYKINLESFLP